MTDPTQNPTEPTPTPEPDPGPSPVPAVDPTPEDAQPVPSVTTQGTPTFPTLDQFQELRRAARERAHEQAITDGGSTFTDTGAFSTVLYRCSTCMSVVAVLDDDADMSEILAVHTATHNS